MFPRNCLTFKLFLEVGEQSSTPQLTRPARSCIRNLDIKSRRLASPGLHEDLQTPKGRSTKEVPAPKDADGAARPLARPPGTRPRRQRRQAGLLREGAATQPRTGCARTTPKHQRSPALSYVHSSHGRGPLGRAGALHWELFEKRRRRRCGEVEELRSCLRFSTRRSWCGES